MSKHGVAWLQTLKEDVHTSPVAGVQATLVAPQIQGALLAIVPFVLAQARPSKMHTQATPELQLLVEDL